MDRVAMKYIINPLNMEETAEMIAFRLRSAGLSNGQSLFAPSAIEAIHRFTQGYPRRIALVCHNAVEAVVMRGRSTVDDTLIQELIHDESRWVHETTA